MRHLAALTCVALFALATPALAQSADPAASRFEVGIGAAWIGRTPLGDSAATETTAPGSRATLFSLSSELASAGEITAHAGVRITPAWRVEAALSYSKPELRIGLAGDTEAAPPVTAVESIQQYMIGGNVLWFVPRLRRPRLEPFVIGGGGYLRQLHEAATLVETGRYYDIGGGVSWLLATGRHFHTSGAGLRVDARAVVRSRGVAFDGGSRTSPAVGASLFLRF
jgi:Outer membrane protein beta-barrel domain